MEHPPQPEEIGAEPDEALSNVRRIQRGIVDALMEDRPIDDATARRIASQLHGGQDSALYRLASSGALPDGLEAEIETTAVTLLMIYETWTDVLLSYVDARGADRGRRDDWTELTADDPEQAIGAARAAAIRERRVKQALFERYVALGVSPEDAEAAIENTELLEPQSETGRANAPPPDDD